MSQSLEAQQLLSLIAGWETRSGSRYSVLADAIELAARDEELPDGTRLPPERALAERAAVSRGTVVAAYAELADRGLVERRVGSGTRLSRSDRPSPAPVMRAPHFGQLLREEDELIDLAYGTPWADKTIGDVGATVVQARAAGAPTRGYTPFGMLPLREGIAQRLRRVGLPTEPEQLLITAGAQGAISLLASALVRRGDRVVVETPTYPGAMETFSRAGAHVIGVRRDAEGPRPDDLARALAGPGAALVYLVPTHHNPTGTTVRERRRRQLLAVCAEHGVLLVEDETLADVAFDPDATRPPTLAALAGPEADVVTIGSFSKVVWGGLRTGWMRGDPALIRRLARQRTALDLGGGMLDQAAAHGTLPRYDALARARGAQARERYGVLRDLLADHLPDWRIAAEPQGGWSCWIRLPRPLGDEVLAAGMRRGVILSSGTGLGPDDGFCDHVRLCFAADPDLLREAVRRIAVAWAEVAGASPSGS